MRGRVSAGIFAGALAGALVATPAVAAETGGARLLSTSAEVTSSAGVCSFRSSATGSYWVKCSNGGRGGTYAALLAGAPAPTCWLLPPGYETDLTPTGPAPADLVMHSVTTVPLEPEVSPSATPTGSPTPPAPVPTPSEPVETPTETPVETPSETPVETPSETPVEVLKVCIDGVINPVTLAPPSATSPTYVTDWVLLSDPDRPRFWWELTDGQRRWATRAEKPGSIANGTLVSTPSTTPRVGQTIGFSVANPGSTTIEMGDARMRARLISLTVQPGEPGREPVVCDGQGRVLVAGDPDRSGSDVCSFVYRQTSGGQAAGTPNTFDVVGTQTWRIETSVDDGATWSEHRTVERTVRAGLRVTEVQTLVVP